MDQIIKEGRVKRGWLGIEPQDMTVDLARAFGVEEVQGAIIAGVVRDGPAMQAGLQVGASFSTWTVAKSRMPTDF